MENIRQLKKQYEREWLAMQGVVAVGIGKTADGNTGIIVSVSKNAPEIRRKIPTNVDGIPIEVIESGKIEAL